MPVRKRENRDYSWETFGFGSDNSHVKTFSSVVGHDKSHQIFKHGFSTLRSPTRLILHCVQQYGLLGIYFKLVLKSFTKFFQISASAVSLDDSGECGLWSDYNVSVQHDNTLNDDNNVMYYAYAMCVNIGELI